MKKAFTIIELLAVIAILAVLMGIVTTAAATSIKRARAQKTSALCALVQSGLATYYAQKEEWPVSLPDSRENKELKYSETNFGSDKNKIVLNSAEVREAVKKLVQEAQAGNPMIDIAGLFVSRDPGGPSGMGFGLDLMTAVRGTKKNPKKMKLAEMYFGYPETDTGHFRHFKIIYSIPGDAMTVTTMDTEPVRAQYYE